VTRVATIRTARAAGRCRGSVSAHAKSPGIRPCLVSTNAKARSAPFSVRPLGLFLAILLCLTLSDATLIGRVGVGLSGVWRR
jgi:hypothetical protein